VYFQEPGRAEAEFERDVRTTIRKVMNGLSGDVREVPTPIVPEGGELLDIFEDPDVLPDWLKEEDVDVYTREFVRTGFASPLAGSGTSTGIGSCWRRGWEGRWRSPRYTWQERRTMWSASPACVS
jgi:hypothetical protein